MKELFTNLNAIYDLLEDDVSKNIFKEKCTQYITKDNFRGLFPYMSEYLKSAINTLDEAIIEIDNGRKAVIYGCSEETGVFTYKQLNNTTNVVFCDRRFETIKFVSGKPVISPVKMLENYTNELILLCVGEATNSVYEFLLNNNVPKENLKIVGTKDLQNQYFDEVLNFTENEVFVDCGGLDGATSELFAKKMNYCYKKMFIFEPDISNIVLLEKNSNLKKLHNIQMFPIGVWSQEDSLSFDGESNAGSKISETGNYTIKVNSLDNVLKDEQITFIKMDIEGAELNALKGATTLIKKFKPKLAISIYHKEEDLFDIPNYIHSIVPEYKLFLRHYSTCLTETILYATV